MKKQKPSRRAFVGAGLAASAAVGSASWIAACGSQTPTATMTPAQPTAPESPTSTNTIPSEQDENMNAYLEITLQINPQNRPAAVEVYQRYRQPFLDEAAGAQSKRLLVRDQDVQVLHGFDTTDNAAAYLETSLFANDIVGELGPLLAADPEVRIYQVA